MNTPQTRSYDAGAFDCIVLELPWEKFTVGAKLEPETIHAAASKHLGGADDPKLRDWYPAVVGDVPLYLARICWVEQLR